MIQQMVLFGASGDLTSRLLLPAVAQLAEAGLLPSGFTILGAANEDWSTADFRQHIAAKLKEHSSVAPATQEAVVERLTFQTTDVTDAEAVRRLFGDDHPDTLAYLALPPFLLRSVLPALATAGLRISDALAIEKPFGNDLASARELNQVLRLRLPEPTIFRVDHFLSSELVRRVITLRFLNRVFEPVWNAEHVERVDISWLEDLTLEGRASYYDGAGAMKDMIQNHLMEIMALVLMEQPSRMDADSFRGARVEALRAVATPAPERMSAETVRGRYAPGTIGSRQVPARRRTRRGPRPEHRDLRVTDPQGERCAVVRRPLHPAVREGASGELRGDRLPLPADAGLPEAEVARRRAERAPAGAHRAVRAAATTVNGPDQRAETVELEPVSQKD